jgi:hypothetical protein
LALTPFFFDYFSTKQHSDRLSSLKGRTAVAYDDAGIA